MSVRTAVFLAVLPALLAAAPARASVMLRQGVPDLARSADLVARGTVKDTRSVLSADGRRVFTYVTLEVAESWKGAPPREVKIRVHGGTVDGIGQMVQGEARFDAGQDVVVFLKRIGPSGAAPVFRVEGMAQGKLDVFVDPVRGEVAAPDLRGLELTDSVERPAAAVANPEPVALESLRSQVREALAR